MFWLGLTTDLIAFLLDAIISIKLYQIFKPFGKTLALISSALRLIAHHAIGSRNLLNHFLAYQVVGDNHLMTTLSFEQLQSFSLLFTEAHQYGYLIAGAFFGIHMLLLGVLIYRSNIFHHFFGGLMLWAAAGYLLESFGNFTIPGNEAWLALLVGITAARFDFLHDDKGQEKN